MKQRYYQRKYLLNSLYKLPLIRSKEDIIDLMRTKYEQRLNPKRYKLSGEALKKLKWVDDLEQKHGGNISRTSLQLCITREWLSKVYSRFQKSDRDPRSLENHSQAPRNTSNRKRISRETENLIVEERTKKYQSTWGKEKLQRVLKRDHDIDVGATTVNRYLKKHKLLNIKLSNKNKQAWKNKILKNRINARPPKALKDLAPGALAEKDMKYIVKQGRFTNPEKYGSSENFYFQHTVIDSFTRIRTVEIVTDSSSFLARRSFAKQVKRFPFRLACVNTDNGGENGKHMQEFFRNNNTVQFYSKIGTPTDNPRVERSHLTDEKEFYADTGNRFKVLGDLQKEKAEYELVYNFQRPHQALGYLTPMEFYELWKIDKEEAYKKVARWKKYLQKQSRRQYESRRIKSKEKIEALMQHISAVLSLDLTAVTNH